jgi:DNA-binding transcriptional MerR regulator
MTRSQDSTRSQESSRRDGGLPDLSGKLYYTIGEVSELTEVKPHVLRYWESEFPSLRPRKDRSGSRRYRRRDIEEILTIKSLLYEEGYRIAGARQVLDQRRKPQTAETDAKQLALSFEQLDRAEQMAQIRRELAEVLELLQDSAPAPPAKKARG